MRGVGKRGPGGPGLEKAGGSTKLSTNENECACLGKAFKPIHAHSSPGKELRNFVCGLSAILNNWYFLQGFNFRYVHAPHDSAKITSFK